MWLDFWRDFIKQQKRDLRRTFLTLLGIVLGSLSIVFLASMLSAASFSLVKMNNRASGDDLSTINKRALEGAYLFKNTKKLDPSDVRAIAQHEAAHTSAVVGSNTMMSQEGSVGKLHMPVGVQSGGTAYALLNHMEILHGRFLTEQEDGQRLCVIGYDIWKQLFKEQWPLKDATILLNGKNAFEVVGVFKKHPSMGNMGDGTFKHDRKLWISQKTYERVINPEKDFREIVLQYPIKDNQLPNLEKNAYRLFPFIKNLHYGVRNFDFLVLNDRFKMWGLIIYALGAIMFSCSVIAMLVGGVNVMNAQLVNLFEKTKEYGLRRAVGASSRVIQRAVLVESALMSLMGGVLGVLLGLSLSWLLSLVLSAQLSEWPFFIESWSIAVALLMSFAVGLLAGIIPAIKAAKLMPSECLRVN